MKTTLGPIDLLIFQSTSFCNLDCKYCYLPDRHLKHKIKSETIGLALKKIVEEKLISDEFSIVWHAGEPTVLPVEFYREVLELIKQIIPANVKVNQHIQTNGTLLNDEWCAFFKESEMKVGVSLDGPKHITDRNRVQRNGKGAFDQIMRGIELLRKYEIEFSVIAVLSAYSLDYPEEIYSFFKEINVQSLCFNMEEEEGIHTQSSLNETTEEKLKAFWQKIFRLQLNKENYIHIREVQGFIETFIKGNFKSNPLHIGQMTHPLRILSIDTEGNFSTFSPELLGMKDEQFGNFCFGNIHRDKFSSIVKNDLFQQISLQIESGIKKCRDSCSYFNFCDGGAPSNKLYENGSFDSTETKYCRHSKKILVDCFLEEIETGLVLS